MAYRDDLIAAHAQVEQLKGENNCLKEQLNIWRQKGEEEEKAVKEEKRKNSWWRRLSRWEWRWQGDTPTGALIIRIALPLLTTFIVGVSTCCHTIDEVGEFERRIATYQCEGGCMEAEGTTEGTLSSINGDGTATCECMIRDTEQEPKQKSFLIPNDSAIRMVKVWIPF